MGSQTVPPSLDFHNPPDALPAYIMFLLADATSMSVIRPLMPAGPMGRGLMPWKMDISVVCAEAIKQLERISVASADNICAQFFIGQNGSIFYCVANITEASEK